MSSVPLPDTSWLNLIAWIYLTINATRVISYVPQILAVWRCTDGALSVSLLTWGSWVLSHVAAMFYGVLVVRDLPFVLITLINLLGCSCVTAIVMQRRAQWRRQRSLPRCVAQIYREPKSESGPEKTQSIEPMREPKVKKPHKKGREIPSTGWNSLPSVAHFPVSHYGPRLAVSPLHTGFQATMYGSATSHHPLHISASHRLFESIQFPDPSRQLFLIRPTLPQYQSNRPPEAATRGAPSTLSL